MTSRVLITSLERPVRPWLRTVLLISAVSLLPAWLSAAQATVALKAVVLPYAVTRSVIIDKSQLQGVDVGLERLHSPATLEATLEQLALLLPELTPVWSEQGVMQAHWTSPEASYALLLWETQTHTTEGLLSGLALTQPLNVKHSTLPEQSAAIHSAFPEQFTAIHSKLPEQSAATDWLPKQTQQLFRWIDKAGPQPIALSSFIVSIPSSQLVNHLTAHGQRNGWVRLADELTFFRNQTRLSFQVMTDKGQTTVLVYETSRDAP